MRARWHAVKWLRYPAAPPAAHRQKIVRGAHPRRLPTRRYQCATGAVPLRRGRCRERHASTPASRTESGNTRRWRTSSIVHRRSSVVYRRSPTDDGRWTMDDGRSVSRVVVDGNLNARYAMFIVDDRFLGLGAGFDLADALEHVGLDGGEFVFSHFARLELHLRFEQPLTLPLRVVQLGVGNRGDLVEHERDAVDEKAVEQKHQTRSSFNRMFTKLYGGHGPVYLNVSLSCSAAIDLTRVSNAAS